MNKYEHEFNCPVLDISVKVCPCYHYSSLRCEENISKWFINTNLQVPLKVFLIFSETGKETTATATAMRLIYVFP